MDAGAISSLAALRASRQGDDGPPFLSCGPSLTREPARPASRAAISDPHTSPPTALPSIENQIFGLVTTAANRPASTGAPGITRGDFLTALRLASLAFLGDPLHGPDSMCHEVRSLNLIVLLVSSGPSPVHGVPGRPPLF